jgi:predicted PurR-regulated permease PerM
MLTDLGWLKEAGTVGVFAVLVFMFLRHIKELTKGFLKTIENHITHNTEAIEKNTETLGSVDKTLSQLAGYMRQNGGG